MLALETKKLSKRFGNRYGVKKLSFELPEGAFLSVFGPNGAGKTTLLRMLTTLSRSSEGELTVMGVDAKEEPDQVRGMIGVISHDSMLYPSLTAQENLMFHAKLHGVANPEERCVELLDAVGLRHRRHDTLETFSQGMKQRVTIARALVHDPKLVFLDEPYAGLDPHASAIFDELISAQREGRTFVMVSHDLRKGFDMSTHSLIMSRGEKVFYGENAEVDFCEFEKLYLEAVGQGVS